MNFSTELRVPIVGNLGAVLFLDGGNVWTDPWDFNLNDLRYDVGPGLRYNTPIGPVRLDVGCQLNPIPGLLVNGDRAEAAPALPLQHRPGILMRWLVIRRTVHVVAWIGTLMVALSSRRADRVADAVVPRLDSARHRPRSQAVSRTAS